MKPTLDFLVFKEIDYFALLTNGLTELRFSGSDDPAVFGGIEVDLLLIDGNTCWFS